MLTLDEMKFELRHYGLTRRELQVLHDLFYTDRTMAELAVGLGVTVNTVKTHVRHIYHKTKTRGRMDLYHTLAPLLGQREETKYVSQDTNSGVG